MYVIVYAAKTELIGNKVNLNLAVGHVLHITIIYIIIIVKNIALGLWVLFINSNIDPVMPINIINIR